MNLDLATRLEAVLAGAVTANQPEVHVWYSDWTSANERSSPSATRSALNSATDVIILAAPVANPKREIDSVAIHNKDTASVTVTVKTDDGTTERIVFKATLATLEGAYYDRLSGWYCLTTAGARK